MESTVLARLPVRVLRGARRFLAAQEDAHAVVCTASGEGMSNCTIHIFDEGKPTTTVTQAERHETVSRETSNSRCHYTGSRGSS